MDAAPAAEPSLSPAAADEANAPEPGDGEGNKFQKAISAWRNIDLTKLIPNLDTTASDLVSHQRDALVERKELAQKTKDFRKLDDPAKLVEIKSLLKAYQTYIDLVTNQSKTVSSSFLQLYSSLSEAPDPYPLLEATVDSLVVAEETLPRIEGENARLQETVSKLTTQLDETESRLQTERQSRQSLEASREAGAKEVEASWAAVLAEKEDNWQAKERGLEEKVESQDRLLKELKASYEVSQRLGRDEDDEAGRGGASAAELEILNSDLERSNSRLAEVEARNEQLRLELAQSTTNKERAAPAPVEDDPAFLRLRSENSSLMRKADAAKFERDSSLRDWESNARGLKREIATLKSDCEILRTKVDKWGDYEDVKRELEVLKSIEFSTGDDEDVSAIEEKASSKDADKDPAQNLEQLLLARNKKLNNELTVLRVSHQDLASRLETLQEALSTANMDLEKSRSLTATLENDLARIHQHPHSAVAPSVAGTSRYPSSSHPRRPPRPASPTSSILSGIDGPGAAPTLEALRAGEQAPAAGILPMITAQRDRFKQRNTELEAELARTQQSVATLRAETASLQKDNLSLYEKTRYVSTYARGAGGMNGGAPPPPSPSQQQQQQQLERYRAAYEAKISPFAAFRGRESARAVRRMSVPERAVFQITRLVLATRTSRNLFALYCLGLHLLMFFMLFWASSVDIEKHSAHLADPVTAAVVGAVVEGDEWQQAGFQGVAR